MLRFCVWRKLISVGVNGNGNKNQKRRVPFSRKKHATTESGAQWTKVTRLNLDQDFGGSNIHLFGTVRAWRMSFVFVLFSSFGCVSFVVGYLPHFSTKSIIA